MVSLRTYSLWILFLLFIFLYMHKKVYAWHALLLIGLDFLTQLLRNIPYDNEVFLPWAFKIPVLGVFGAFMLAEDRLRHIAGPSGAHDGI